MAWRVQIAETAAKALKDVTDRREQQLLREHILKLAEDPEKQGKPLVRDLQGYRSARAVGQRYRIIFRCDQAQQVVTVVYVGRRKSGDSQDVYAAVRKLVSQLPPPPPTQPPSTPPPAPPKRRR